MVSIRNPCSKLRAVQPTINTNARTNSFQLFPVNCLPFLTFCLFARGRVCVCVCVFGSEIWSVNKFLLQPFVLLLEWH